MCAVFPLALCETVVGGPQTFHMGHRGMLLHKKMH